MAAMKVPASESPTSPSSPIKQTPNAVSPEICQPFFVVTIDASKAKVPEGYPFTIAQVIDAVETCAKLMYPASPEKRRQT